MQQQEQQQPRRPAPKPINPKMEHVVCLMLENRSFDHMCGFLKQKNPNIEGLTGDESNPYDPENPQEGSVKVNDRAGYFTRVDPDHSVPGTTEEIYGSNTPDTSVPAPMDGFVRKYNESGDKSDKGAAIMECFNPNTVPSISSLANEFAIFDHWFSAVPGPTWPNRMFMHTATSWGATMNDAEQMAIGYPQRTIYDNIYDAGYTFKIYYNDFPSALFLSRLRDIKYWDCIADMATFHKDCKNGTLPNYSFIEPRWYDLFDLLASDQHPPHDVRAGEYLIADVYESLRNGPKWNNTLMVLTYDEHGGFFDHVSPPQNDIPAPDDHRPPASQPPFDFDRLGIRVPTIVVSPWINAGTVIHEPTYPKSGHWTHTSTLATIKKILDLPEFLTKRDEWSPTYEDIVEGRSSPRTDCPTKLPRPGSVEDQGAWRNNSHIEITPQFICGDVLTCRPVSLAPITDLQYEIMSIARGLSVEGSLEEALAVAEVESIQTEHPAALFVMRQLANFAKQQNRKRMKRSWIVV